MPAAVALRPPPSPAPPPDADPALPLLLAAARAAISAASPSKAGDTGSGDTASGDTGSADTGSGDATALASADPETVVALARRHGMTSLLHRHLAARPDVPRALADAVRAAHGRAARRALALAGELARLLRRLEDEGVPALAYKGPALAVQAYGDLSLRSPSDLDLLVTPGDAPRALAVLADAGYRAGYAPTPAQDRCFRATDGDYPLVHGETEALVELHCRASSRRFGVRLETAELATRAVAVPLGGATVAAPAPDDLLLALLVHGAKHRWPRLEWLTAASSLARRAEIDLGSFLARAERHGGRRMALVGLALARDVVGLPLLADVEREIERDPAVPHLRDEARSVLFAGEEPEGETAANLAFNLRAQDGVAARLRFAWRWLTVPGPEDWAAVALPDAAFPLYRALRPARLAWRYGLRRGGGA
jgi:hypothetical protein